MIHTLGDMNFHIIFKLTFFDLQFDLPGKTFYVKVVGLNTIYDIPCIQDYMLHTLGAINFYIISNLTSFDLQFEFPREKTLNKINRPHHDLYVSLISELYVYYIITYEFLNH